MALFSTPTSGSSFFSPKNHEGDLLLFRPIGVIRNYVFPGSADVPADVTEADVFVLDGDQAGNEYEKAVIKPTVLQKALKNTQEPYVLGRLVKGQKAWLLNSATPADAALAEAFLVKKGVTEGDSASADGSDAPY